MQRDVNDRMSTHCFDLWQHAEGSRKSDSFSRGFYGRKGGRKLLANSLPSTSSMTTRSHPNPVSTPSFLPHDSSSLDLRFLGTYLITASTSRPIHRKSLQEEQKGAGGLEVQSSNSLGKKICTMSSIALTCYSHQPTGTRNSLSCTT